MKRRIREAAEKEEREFYGGRAPEDWLQALAPLLREAMAQGSVSGEHFCGQWMDIGTPERLRELDQRLTKR